MIVLIGTCIQNGCDIKMIDEEKLEQARERVIEAISQNMNLYGVTESIGRLYGALYFQEGPLTLDEMLDADGIEDSTSYSAEHEQEFIEQEDITPVDTEDIKLAEPVSSEEVDGSKIVTPLATPVMVEPYPDDHVISKDIPMAVPVESQKEN